MNTCNQSIPPLRETKNRRVYRLAKTATFLPVALVFLAIFKGWLSLLLIGFITVNLIEQGNALNVIYGGAATWAGWMTLRGIHHLLLGR